LPISNRLGDWSETIYNELLYIQNGFYYADEVEHYRGFDRGSLPFGQVMEWLDKLDPHKPWSADTPKLFGPTHRFVGYRRALHTNQTKFWRTWQTEDREITIGQHGKRTHFPWPCNSCLSGKKWTEGLHDLTHGPIIYGERFPEGGLPRSYPHKIPWLDVEDYSDSDYDNTFYQEKEITLMDG
jgi:hypothetical protein